MIERLSRACIVCVVMVCVINDLYHCVMVSLWQIVCHCDSLSLLLCHYNYQCVIVLCQCDENFFLTVSLWQFVIVTVTQSHCKKFWGDDGFSTCPMAVRNVTILPPLPSPPLPPRYSVEQRCQLVILRHHAFDSQCVWHWVQSISSCGLQLSWVLLGAGPVWGWDPSYTTICST